MTGIQERLFGLLLSLLLSQFETKRMSSMVDVATLAHPEQMTDSDAEKVATTSHFEVRATSGCNPEKQQGCTFVPIPNKEPIGKGAFGAAYEVEAHGPGEDPPGTYVWKKFNFESNDQSVRDTAEKARNSLQTLLNFKCPSTMIPVDMAPVVQDGGKTIQGDNGFVFQKMDGDGEKLVARVSKDAKGREKLCGCARGFAEQILPALLCLRMKGQQHLDIKLDNILYKREPPRSGGCPTWTITDFDLMAPVDGMIKPPVSPPIVLAQRSNLIMRGGKINGREDLISFALAYAEFFRSDTVMRQKPFKEGAYLLKTFLGRAFVS